MPLKFALLIPILIFNFSLIAQHSEDEKDHENHDHHEHHQNEIGIANAPVYFIKEKEVAYGLHLHYVRRFKESKFGIGIGYERVFDEHKHNTIGIVGNYSPSDHWSIQLSPGISFEDGSDTSLQPALHI